MSYASIRTFDYVPDLAFRAAFSPVRDSSAQTLKLSVSRPGQPARVVASGDTNSNHSIEGGGMFRAGVQHDPFFFDTAGFNLFVAAGEASFPRPAGKAVNFFGPNVNKLAVVIELPTASLQKSPDPPILHLWSQTANSTGKQVDRTGQPLLNIFLIPPVPRNNTSRGDCRDAFNLGTPTSEFRKFREDMVSVLTGFWKTAPNRAGALVDRLLLPAVMTYDTSLTFDPEGFPKWSPPSGRRRRLYAGFGE